MRGKLHEVRGRSLIEMQPRRHLHVDSPAADPQQQASFLALLQAVMGVALLHNGSAYTRTCPARSLELTHFLKRPIRTAPEGLVRAFLLILSYGPYQITAGRR